jgi:hypothetical protein
MDYKPILSPKIITPLLILEAFFLSFIAFGIIDLIYVLISLGVTILAVVLLIRIAEVYGKRIHLFSDLNNSRDMDRFRTQLFGRQAGVLNNWRKGFPIWVLFMSRIVLTYLFLLYNVPWLFLLIVAALLEYLNLKFIGLSGESMWLAFSYLTQVMVYLLIFLAYADILWVLISLILYFVLFFFVIVDLNFLQLRAFIPDILTILLVFWYGYPEWALPIALLSFIYNLFETTLTF